MQMNVAAGTAVATIWGRPVPSWRNKLSAPQRLGITKKSPKDPEARTPGFRVVDQVEAHLGTGLFGTSELAAALPSSQARVACSHVAEMGAPVG